MLIQNLSSMTQATPPARHASDGMPDVAVARISNVATKAEVRVPAAPAEPSKTVQESTSAQLQTVVDNINKVLQQANKNLEFSVDAESKKPVVKLVDAETGDVIRQFPSDEMLAISKAVGQMQERLQQASLQKGQAPSAQGLLVKHQA